MLVEFKGMFPDVEKAAFIAPNAAICGDVAMDEGSSVWFSAVIRGEVAPIRIGKNSNVQDNAMLHSDYDCPVTLGDRVSVGHNAIIHGAVIGDNCLIGMGATLLDNARIPSGCIIAANALVLSNAQLEPNSVYAGVPAKKVKEVTAEQREEIIRRTAHDYMLYASWYGEPEE